MNFNGLSLIVILIKHQGIAGFEMHLLFTHLPGDVLRDTLYGTHPEFGKQLVACRLVGDGDARAEILPQISGNLLDSVCFHGSRNEDAFLSVIVIHGKFHGDDGTAIFNLKDIDVKPFSLYAPFSDEQGVFGKDMLSYTHRFQKSHLHTLTTDYSLVPVDAGPYGIPHVFFIPVANRGM